MTNSLAKNLHAAIVATVEAGMTYSCPGFDPFNRKCETCPLVVYERDGTTYCGFYELHQTLKRMGPKTKRGDT